MPRKGRRVESLNLKKMRFRIIEKFFDKSFFMIFSIFISHLFPPQVGQERAKRTLRSSSQAATCPSAYHTRWRIHAVSFYY